MPTKAVVSEEEYLRTSYSGVDREFRDGEVLERSVPAYSHGQMQGLFFVFFWLNCLTRSLFPTIEPRIRLRSGRYVIPDVAVFWPSEPNPGLPEERPLIVVEILSPDDRMSDVIDKLTEYHDSGIPHIWLADPSHKAFYIFRDGLHQVESALVPEVNLELRFAELKGPATAL